ncbi:MAG: dethiobiotin synthase [Dokdonella sp.]
MMHGVFVSGTDTGIGKTRVSTLLLRAMRRSGIAAIGMKPVASGCESTSSGLRNEDALALIEAAGVELRYEDVNPYAFRDPIAPHLAAADADVVIDPQIIVEACERLRRDAEFVVVEGVGGWLAPLGGSLMQADLARALDLPVLLVVGLRLGCLNHALLTARAIEADGCRLVGWIGNRIDADMLRVEDNIETLISRIQAPLLGIVEHEGSPHATNDINALDRAALVLLAE